METPPGPNNHFCQLSQWRNNWRTAIALIYFSSERVLSHLLDEQGWQRSVRFGFCPKSNQTESFSMELNWTEGVEKRTKNNWLTDSRLIVLPSRAGPEFKAEIPQKTFVTGGEVGLVCCTRLMESPPPWTYPRVACNIFRSPQAFISSLQVAPRPLFPCYLPLSSHKTSPQHREALPIPQIGR